MITQLRSWFFCPCPALYVTIPALEVGNKFRVHLPAVKNHNWWTRGQTSSLSPSSQFKNTARSITKISRVQHALCSLSSRSESTATIISPSTPESWRGRAERMPGSAGWGNARGRLRRGPACRERGRLREQSWRYLWAKVFYIYILCSRYWAQT